MRPIIIGNSTAAIAAVEAIRQHAPDVSPLLISDEALPPYSPTALIALAEGRIAEEEVFFRDAGVYRRNGVEEKLGRRALGVDARKRVVTVEGGEKFPFATLLLAAGARPKSPQAPGLAEDDAITLRTLTDARRLKQRMKNSKHACIIGAGLIGLELAQALLAKGIGVHVAEIQPQIIPAAFDAAGAAVIQQVFEGRGARFALNAAGLNFKGRKGSRARQVGLNGAPGFEADLIVWTAGVSPRIDLVEGTPIRVNRGIGVDSRMETSVPGIFAAGDIAEAADFFTGGRVLNPILPAAASQGRVAGINMVGGQAEYSGNLKMNIFSYFGRLAFSVGEIASAGDEELVLRQSDTQYGKILLRSGKLAGGVFVNMDLEPGIFRAMVASREDFSPFRQRFMDDVKSFSRVWMMKRRTEGVGPREGFSRAGRRAAAGAGLPIAVDRRP